MTGPARKVAAVYAVAVLVLAMTTGGVLGGVTASNTAGNDGVALSCVGNSGGAVYETDSGLTAYENDPDVYYGSFGAAGNSVTFGDVTLSAAGNAEVRVDDASGERTCLGDVDATRNDITISPDGESGLTVAGAYAGLAFRDAAFDDTADGEADLTYDATTPTSVTVTDTGLADGETVTAVDSAADSELDSATVGADGSVTFDGLPSGTYHIDLRTGSAGSGGGSTNFVVTDVSTNTPVTGGETLTVTATIENTGDASGTQTVELRDFGDTAVDSQSVTLDPDRQTEVTLEWVTNAGNAASGEITVATDDDSAARSATIEEADDDDETSGSGGGGGADPNDPPNAIDDAYRTVENTTITVATDDGVLDNDNDPDGDALSATVESVPTKGTLSLAENGSFVYTPDPGFAGTDSFTYEVSDGDGADDTATVNITVMSGTVEWTTPPAFDDETIRLAVGEERTLNASEARLSDEAIARYEWSVDGEDRSGETTTLAFEETGEYTVELTVTNAAGQTTTATTTVVVDNETDSGPIGDDTPSQTPTTEPATTTSGDGAGFGIVAALVALLGAALLAARRRS